MNGDQLYQKIDKRLTVMEAVQRERHEVNKKDIDVLFKKIDKFNNLPCKTHVTKIDTNNTLIKGLYGAFLTVVVIGIGLGIWMKIIMQ